MLDQHLPYSVVVEVRINGLAAQLGEGIKVLAECGILFVLRFEDCRDAFGQLWNLLRELGDGLFPVGYVGQLVVEEEFEDVNQLVGGFDGVVEGDAVVLIEDGVAGRLEERVGEGIALLDLGLDLVVELVVVVLGLPEALQDGQVVVEDGAVGAEVLLASALEGELFDEVPVVG